MSRSEDRFRVRMGIELPPGNGSGKVVLVTAPLLTAVAVVSQCLAPYLATFESLIGCAACLRSMYSLRSSLGHHEFQCSLLSLPHLPRDLLLA